MRKIKTISFRATEEDLEIIESIKKREGGDLRTLTDSEVLRFVLRNGNKKTIPKKEVAEEDEYSDEVPEYGVLTEEEKSLGYQYLKGDLCDKDGYPIEQMSGDVVIRNGEVYATEPKRSELKEMAKENSAALMVETPEGKMNEAMAGVLGVIQVPFELSQKGVDEYVERMVTESNHSEPGMLSEFDGVDEDPDFIG